MSFCGALALLIAGVLFGIMGESFVDEGKVVMTTMIVVITALLAQGYIRQISMVLSLGRTGALDKNMSLFILLMDLSTIAFALTMNIDASWPLLLLATVSGITKIILLYLFRWVRISETAFQRRQLVN